MRIHAIETSVPDRSYDQDWACELMQEHCTERRGVRRIIRSIYRNSGIRTRHSVIDVGGSEGLFFDGGTLLPTPGTDARNRVYTREARHHFETLARKLVDRAGMTPTHVVTVSCTGFFAPGPDYHVVRALGLPGSTPRFHLGFMGCYAAFQGLRMARAFCREDPDAVVLVLCVELCTLHLRFTEDTDDLIAGALFADGAAGALVSARASTTGRTLSLDSLRSELTDEGEQDMAWTIGDEGFRMKLSTYVPAIIEANLERVLGPVRADFWAVHPGGRAILDRVEQARELDPVQIAASRRVLREYGNMSSATIFFVLKELLDGEQVQNGDRILAMAFGPGLTVESGIMRVEDR